jgi:methyltransferase (TIGR00027 family)
VIALDTFQPHTQRGNLMAHPVAETAVGPMTIVAVEQYEPDAQRLVHDDLAYYFLPSGVQRIVRLARWRSMRNLLIGVTEKTAHGIWGSMLCRKRCIDDRLREAAPDIDAVVILGAGLDTRAYRLEVLTQLPVFEVDLPENIAFKQARLRELHQQRPASLQLVPVDFERQDLESALVKQGFRTTGRTFFIWEAVTQYLTEGAVRATFGFLAKAPSGSRLVFTYVRQDFLDGVNLYGAAPTYKRFRLRQQLWQFGLAPERVAPFLAEYGWNEVEQAGAEEYTRRYVAPSGRALPISELERSVYAEKR